MSSRLRLQAELNLFIGDNTGFKEERQEKQEKTSTSG